jgi:heme-degrading monooxygenase HmoA
VHLIVWRFAVRPEHRSAFEQAYGPTGDWATLFGRGAGYVGTELVALSDPGSYLTLDRWESAAAFAQFEHAWSQGYAELDQRLALLTDEETFIGAGDAVN